MKRPPSQANGNRSVRRKRSVQKLPTKKSLEQETTHSVTDVVPSPNCALPEAIRIVLVDDHPLFRHGLVQLLNSYDGFCVCGVATTSPEAMTIIRNQKPDMVIA